MQIYQVGGAVRDKLLGIKAHDTDYVVVGATEGEMKALGFKPVGKYFPVFLHPVTKEEYALARLETKTGDKHTDFEFVFSPDITLRQDLERRDLTCNAIAYDEESQTYIDYFGGIQDIKERLLRHINAAHFVEDPLRVLRVCRLSAQLDFEIFPETLQLCKKMVSSGALEHLSIERILEELVKALKTRHPSKFFAAMHDIGALTHIMPELEALYTVPEPAEKQTSFERTMQSLDQCQSQSLLVKYAVLTHHFGKALTPQNCLPYHNGHENRAGTPIAALSHRLNVPKQYLFFAKAAAKYHTLFPRIFKLRARTLYRLTKNLTKSHTSYINEYIELCRADFESIPHQNLQKSRRAFEERASRLKFAFDTLQSAKASDMPGFEHLPKDAKFAKIFEAYQISILTDALQHAPKQPTKKGLSVAGRPTPL